MKNIIAHTNRNFKAERSVMRNSGEWTNFVFTTKDGVKVSLPQSAVFKNSGNLKKWYASRLSNLTVKAAGELYARGCEVYMA